MFICRVHCIHCPKKVSRTSGFHQLALDGRVISYFLLTCFAKQIMPSPSASYHHLIALTKSVARFKAFKSGNNTVYKCLAHGFIFDYKWPCQWKETKGNS